MANLMKGFLLGAISTFLLFAHIHLLTGSDIGPGMAYILGASGTFGVTGIIMLARRSR